MLRVYKLPFNEITKSMKTILSFGLLLCMCLTSACNASIKHKSDSGSDQTEAGSTTDPEIEELYGGNEEVEELKQIDWKDGNTYSYAYTEEIQKTDSMGNPYTITVYKSNKPDDSEVTCDTKVCKWCGKEQYARSFVIEEYPNINWLRGEADLLSVFSMMYLIFDNQKYMDLDNNKVRTEWRVNCDYSGPDGFCSLKCENEYKYR